MTPERSPGDALARTTLTRSSFLRGSALAVAAVGAGFLSACTGPSGSSGAAGEGNGTTDLTFLSYLTLDTLSMSPEMVGLAGGYFADAGLDTTVEAVKGSPVALQTLIAGAGELTRVGAIDLVSARTEQDQPLVNVGTIVRRPSLRIMHSKDRPLATAEDFVGKTIGVPSQGGTSEKTLLLMLENSGVDSDQVKRQVVAQTPASFEMVQRGQLDGYMGSIDIALMVSAMNDEAAMLDPSDVADVQADTQVYVATEQGLEEHGDDIRAYLGAVKASVQSIIDDDDRSKTIELLRRDYSFASLDDDEVARDALDAAVALWTDGGAQQQLLETDADAWQAAVDELAAAGYAKAGTDASAWVDNSFLS